MPGHTRTVFSRRAFSTTEMISFFAFLRPVGNPSAEQLRCPPQHSLERLVDLPRHRKAALSGGDSLRP